jgi:hypothetical protein
MRRTARLLLLVAGALLASPLVAEAPYRLLETIPAST